MDVIIYPCSNHDAELDNRSEKGTPDTESDDFWVGHLPTNPFHGIFSAQEVHGSI